MPPQTDYQLFPEVELDARPRYFDGQFLRSQDFVDEQRYHVDRLRRHVRDLQIAGVTSGLGVTAAGALKVSVAPGTAVDSSGRQIVVVAAATVTIAAELTRPAGYILVARYSERGDVSLGGRDNEPGTRGFTRFREEAQFELLPDSNPVPAGAVGLAQLAVAADGTVTVSTPPAVRRYSGLRLPGPGGAGPELTTGGDAAPRRLHLTGELHVSERMMVTGGVIQRGGAPVTNTTDLGLYSQVDQNWVRFVSKSGRHVFFNDGGRGTTEDMAIEKTGDVTVRASLKVPQLRATTNLGVALVADAAPRARVEINTAAGNWLYLRQDRTTGGGGGYIVHNPWDAPNTPGGGDERNRFEIAYQSGTGDVRWGIFAIHGPSNSVGVNNNTPKHTLHVGGRMMLDAGVIQRGGDAITSTSELGLYSQVDGAGNRYVTKNGGHTFYSDGGVGTTPVLAIDKGGDAALKGNLRLGGRITVDNGVIQRGGDLITSTSDLGLYSQVEANWVRYVSKNGRHAFFNDGGTGSAADLIVDKDGTVTVRGELKAASATLTGMLRTGDIEWGSNNMRTQSRENAGLRGDAGARSGFFEWSAASPTNNWPPNSSSFWHLLDVRHSNPANNYSMQLAGSFYDQRLWFRKLNNNAAAAWSRIPTTDDLGVTLEGKVGIGKGLTGTSAAPKAHLDIAQNTRSGTHPDSVKGLYVTGDFGSVNDGVEFRHSNGTQGLGFGYAGLYATGTNADQNIYFMPRGSGYAVVQRPSKKANGEANTTGTQVFLELFQDSAATAEVYPCLRFHHGGRFWHRIEARPNGLHVRTGDLAKEDAASLHAGDINSNSRAVTTGNVERLRIVRGIVNAGGGIEAGSGFSVSQSNGCWKISFDPAFSGKPTVVATQQYPNDDNFSNDGGNTRDNATIVAVSKSAVLIKTGNGDGDQTWRRFHFIAIGT